MKPLLFCSGFFVNFKFMDEANNFSIQCYCCGYLSLEDKGSAEICPACFWEDDEETNLDRLSNPNRMTLRKGRENFLKFGACEKQFVKYVEKNPQIKYIKKEL